MDNGKNKFITKKIKVFGIVQGVGFRPLVYRIAKKLEMKGSVRNVGGYVEIFVSSEEERIKHFLQELRYSNGGGCEIVKIELEDSLQLDFTDFLILGSGESSEVSIIPPDLPVCLECQKELYEGTDRRYLNPFISCMSCGPRYTIIEDLPYDRQNTTMIDYEMCPSCRKEYTSPEHRRFHAQTVSCNECGPYLIYKGKAEDKAEDKFDHKAEGNKGHSNQQALETAIAVIKSGGVIAVKGIGGFQFVCSPFMEETVVKLRKLKGREEKPFAVMFNTIESIEDYCQVSAEERALLLTKARPIVLLYHLKDSFVYSTNKGSIYCGAFLPYTPLQLILTKECGPLIMTSANLSNQPMIKDDEVMLSLVSDELEGVLYNTRRIERSVDDSVVKVIDGKPQIIRRSRGYVPYPVFIGQKDIDEKYVDSKYLEEKKNIFAAGGDLKAAFCLFHEESAVLSQYFGDLEEINILEEYKKSFRDLTRLLKITPSLAVCDLHPNYFSSGFAKSLGISILEVQHHHAHIASVMAEHDLKGKVIGIAFDGTGYGTDGNVWGSEFLICEGADFTRAAHLKYTTMLGGDESMRDAKKTATCFLLNSNLEEQIRDERRDLIKVALSHKINSVLTSSMGRLFDAVASILEISQINRYEGECAAFLEREAVLAIKAEREPVKLSFAISEENEIIEIDAKPVLEALCRLRNSGDTGALALGFHYALAEVIYEVCVRLREKYLSSTVALSGGVFQNTVLSDHTLKLLRQKGFTVYVNLAVPPNDGGISLGQTYLGIMSER